MTHGGVEGRSESSILTRPAVAAVPFKLPIVRWPAHALPAPMIALGGLHIEVVPEARLSAPEKDTLERLATRAAPPSPTTSAKPFVLELVGGAVVATRDPGLPLRVVDDAPAAVGREGSRVTVRHRRVEAELDPFARHGWLRRGVSVGWPLEVTLRTALAARLPLEGGLPRTRRGSSWRMAPGRRSTGPLVPAGLPWPTLLQTPFSPTRWSPSSG
jgi:hypothetical protein